MDKDMSVWISILIPVFRAVSTLEDTCTSLARALKAYPEGIDRGAELILIDDGSDDGSGELCDRIADGYKDASVFKRVISEHRENSGVSGARNRGLELAGGEYVCFVDADDEVTEEFFRVFGEAVRLHPDAWLLDMTDSLISGTAVDACSFLENALLGSDTHVWGKLFRRDVTEGIRFREGLTIGEDMLFLFDLIFAGHGAGIVCIPCQEYIYRTNETGAMLSPYKESYLDQIICWELAGQRIEELRTRIRLSHFVDVRLACIQIMASFLVIGKASVSGNREIIPLADKTIKRALKVNGAFAGLSFGYKIKSLVYRISPSAYMRMYAGWKGQDAE